LPRGFVDLALNEVLHELALLLSRQGYEIPQETLGKRVCHRGDIVCHR